MKKKIEKNEIEIVHIHSYSNNMSITKCLDLPLSGHHSRTHF
jgi:hypothetical protein